MLVGCETPHGPWRAAYDPLGRRVSKTWQGRTTTYYWDSDRLAAEVADSGKVRLYIYPSPLALVPMMFIDYASVDADPASGKRYFVFTNQIGVPIFIEDAGGRVVWSARVEPYGTVHVSPGAEVECNLRFPGHYHDAETGLHYNRFRYYSPELGRYLQSDPIGIAGGVNLYAYPASPLVHVDVRGLSHCGKKHATADEMKDCEDCSRAEAANRRKTVFDQQADVKARQQGPPPVENPSNARRVPQDDTKHVLPVEDGTPPGRAKPDAPATPSGFQLPLKGQEANDAAARLGFRRTNERSRGQPVYTNGRTFISPDVDGHNGGAWKQADSVRNLGRKNTRMGTYDIDLNRIGD
jgi:RHS repeat-associated protein